MFFSLSFFKHNIDIAKKKKDYESSALNDKWKEILLERKMQVKKLNNAKV